MKFQYLLYQLQFASYAYNKTNTPFIGLCDRDNLNCKYWYGKTYVYKFN